MVEAGGGDESPFYYKKTKKKLIYLKFKIIINIIILLVPIHLYSIKNNI